MYVGDPRWDEGIVPYHDQEPVWLELSDGAREKLTDMRHYIGENIFEIISRNTPKNGIIISAGIAWEFARLRLLAEDVVSRERPGESNEKSNLQFLGVFIETLSYEVTQKAKPLRPRWLMNDALEMAVITKGWHSLRTLLCYLNALLKLDGIRLEPEVAWQAHFTADELSERDMRGLEKMIVSRLAN